MGIYKGMFFLVSELVVSFKLIKEKEYIKVVEGE